ncbi:tRNA (uridine(54)-C5)-methyltransferase TrmA [Agaribacterium haliotis]|uniref:tRNA (uridine(54)-C5)-methyltransferase TrmA n=1 Tax=Agaribacterium haliotis TaxID=2013869 RepID=UPI000BB59646|nr:tRNA (uridine(54)-C5)-methyltransferase TrmA [Agaribacterium haliotis]
MRNLPPGKAAPDLYEQQFATKLDACRQEFADFYSAEFDAYRSDCKHYRMRAEFRIWHNDSGAHYVMFEPGQNKQPIIINDFDIASETIYKTMQPLLSHINQHAELNKRLFQIEFLSSLKGELLVSLIYHRALGDDWLNLARELESTFNLRVIGRSRKQKVVVSQDWISETLNLDCGTFVYQQVETGFTQPNAGVNQHMLNWAVKHSSSVGGDLLELYCGNANFTIPLSTNFDKVLATELAKISTRSALHNIAENQRNNIQLARLSAEEATEALTGVREFRRLKEIDLNSYNFSTIFVDPPRAGIDDDTLAFMSRFNNIIYISCNPVTLRANLGKLDASHVVERMALFDQFPYTEHRECGAILKKRN